MPRLDVVGKIIDKVAGHVDKFTLDKEEKAQLIQEINKAQNTVTRQGKKTEIRVEGRHDPCVAPRAVPIAEAMVALTLIDHLYRTKFSKL